MRKFIALSAVASPCLPASYRPNDAKRIGFRLRLAALLFARKGAVRSARTNQLGTVDLCLSSGRLATISLSDFVSLQHSRNAAQRLR